MGYRRMLVSRSMVEYIIPKNILIIGPTGVGKTEMARRIAKLYNAPFIKVEATRFTEVGYVGKDVESIIRDLVDTSMKKEIKKRKESVSELAKIESKKKIIDILLKEKSIGRKALKKNNNITYKFLEKKT